VPEFDATFTVSYGILRGEMTLKLEHRDGGYLYETSLRPRGLVSWFRRGAIDERTNLVDAEGTVRPLDYASIDTIANPVRYTQYRFGPDLVTGEYKTQQIDLPMRKGGHNRISVHIAMMKALQSGDAFNTVPVLDRGRWKEYRFEVVHNQVVYTPSGRFDTVEVSYSSTDSDKSWSLHFAEELDYVPVALIYREGRKTKSRAELAGIRTNWRD
jgi:hypothetical protein